MTFDQTPDLPLLRKVNEWVQTQAVIDDPADREWDQGMWRTLAEDRNDQHGRTDCGTAYCVAGYVGYLNGQAWWTNTIHQSRLASGMFVDEYAQRTLGLTDDQAADLFHPDNTAEDVDRIVRGIFTVAGERY